MHAYIHNHSFTQLLFRSLAHSLIHLFVCLFIHIFFNVINSILGNIYVLTFTHANLHQFSTQTLEFRLQLATHKTYDLFKKLRPNFSSTFHSKVTMRTNLNVTYNSCSIMQQRIWHTTRNVIKPFYTYMQRIFKP